MAKRPFGSKDFEVLSRFEAMSSVDGERLGLGAAPPQPTNKAETPHARSRRGLREGLEKAELGRVTWWRVSVARIVRERDRGEGGGDGDGDGCGDGCGDGQRAPQDFCHPPPK